MIQEFLKEYVRKIVSKPECVKIAQRTEGNICNITIFAHEGDVGRIVGKNGKMISAIKTLISACKAKDGVGYKIVVEAI